MSDAISAATKRASACSSSTSTTRTGSPSPRSEKSSFGFRSRFWSMTVLAARRMRFVDRTHVSVLAAEELQQPVLRVVRVLVLVDEDVPERALPALERVRKALE